MERQQLMHALTAIIAKWADSFALQNGDMKWFSEQWTSSDFLALGVPVNTDMQKDISSYETFAQFCLLYTLCHFFQANDFLSL